MRMLHLADLHLGWEPGYMDPPKAARRRQRRDALLEKAVDVALDPANSVSLVVIAGDLFETHTPPQDLVGHVRGQLQRLVSAGIHVVTVPGNHDERTYHNSVYRVQADRWPGILVQNPEPEHVASLEADGETVHVYSLAYTGGLTPASRPLAHFPRLEASGIHLASFHGTLGDWGGERSLPLEPQALARAGYDYVALGHIHRHQVQTAGGTTICYAGAVEGKGFHDPGVGHLTLVTLQPGTQRIEQLPVAVQTVEDMEIDAGAFDTVQALEDAVRTLGDPEKICRVRLSGAPPFDLDAGEVEAAAAGQFFYLRVVDETSGLAPAVLDGLEGEGTVRGLFVRRMHQRMDGAAADAERKRTERALRLGLQALERRQI